MTCLAVDQRQQRPLFARDLRVGRQHDRHRQHQRGADERRWTTTALNRWSNPGTDAANLGLVADEEKVLLTGRHDMGRDEIVAHYRDYAAAIGTAASAVAVLFTAWDCGHAGGLAAQAGPDAGAGTDDLLAAVRLIRTAADR